MGLTRTPQAFSAGTSRVWNRGYIYIYICIVPPHPSHRYKLPIWKAESISLSTALSPKSSKYEISRRSSCLHGMARSSSNYRYDFTTDAFRHSDLSPLHHGDRSSIEYTSHSFPSSFARETIRSCRFFSRSLPTMCGKLC